MYGRRRRRRWPKLPSGLNATPAAYVVVGPAVRAVMLVSRVGHRWGGPRSRLGLAGEGFLEPACGR